jgi:flagellar hook assembly protein FlgD
MTIAEESLPLSFHISQNYPNPFNPITRITYSIPKESQVTISIFNLLGQKIVDLVSQNITPGEYSMTWNGTNRSGEAVPSGIYIYSIEADEFQSSKKMVMIK